MNPINPNNQLVHVRPEVKAWGYVPPMPVPIKVKRLFDEITDYLAREQARERDRRPNKIQRKEITVVSIEDISNGAL